MSFSKFTLSLFILLAVGCRSIKETDISSSVKSGEIELNHKYFSVHFDPKWKLAGHVRYSLQKAQTENGYLTQSGCCKADPMLIAPHESFTNSDYDEDKDLDKGHLVPF